MDEQTPMDSLDLRLAVEAALDPRSREFLDAIKLTPATLAHFNTNGAWLPAEHLLYTSSIIAHEVSMGDARIIIEEPPRHGKSEEASVHTPIWFLEKFPWAHVLLTTYAADLAKGFGRRVRDTFLQNPKGVLTTRIRDDVQQVAHFLTNEGGSMSSVGIGGPISGRGAHLLVVDDYIKNWVEASSDVTLKSIWDWFGTTAYTRLEPGGSCIILATRWTINDLIGRLKEADKNHMWTVIRLPAIAEANDPLNRNPGEALWPARYPIDKLRQIQSVVGDFVFSAMYQQNPKSAAETKADISQLRELDVIQNKQLFRWIRSWDTAATKEGGDWSVGTLMGTDGRPGSSTALTVLADMEREQWGPAELEINMRRIAEADTPNVPIIIEQEPGASGKAYAQHLATNVLRGFRVTIKPPAGVNKWIRAQPYIAAVSHGRIALLRAAWNKAHKDELEIFPNGRWDDTVDSVAQGFNELHLTKVVSPTWGRSESSESGAVRQGTGKIIRGVVFGRRVA
jgi:predicted phage terminase large subunit-like protein